MELSESSKRQVAKSFTELAIQSDLIPKCSSATETAKEVTNFFNTIVKTLDKTTKE